MRQYIIIGIMMTISIFGYGQSAFNTSFDHDTLQDHSFSLLSTSDGGFLLGSISYDPFAGWDATFIVKTDCKGDTLWTKVIEFSTTGADNMKAVVEVEDGYVGAGGAQDTVLLNTDFLLFKLDFNGNLVWSKLLGDVDSDNGEDMVKSIDGGFALIGSTLNNTAGGTDILLIKADENGNQVWSETYGGTGNEYAYSIFNSLDGGYVIAGETQSFGAGGVDLYLLKVDSLGVLEWDVTYGSSANDLCGSAVATPDGGYVLVGGYNDGGQKDGYIVKTDSNGVLVWSKEYGGADFESFTDVQVLEDGSGVVVGNKYLGTAKELEGWLMRFDQNGDSTWATTYGSPDTINDYLYGVELTSDNGFVLTGSYGHGSVLSNPNMWLIKTDSLGCDTCSLDCITCDFILPLASAGNDTIWIADSGDVQFTGSATVANDWYWDFGDGEYSYEQNPLHTFTDSGTYTVTMYASFGSCTDTVTLNVVVVDTLTGIYEFADKPELRMYPNPTSGNVTFFSTEKGNGVIYDITGKLVHQFGIEEKNTTFDASSLNAGLYLVRCTSSNGSSFIAKLVVNTGF